MKRAIQSLAQALLAVCCLAGCSRNEPISSANLPRAADACVVEAKQAVVFYEYEKALKLWFDDVHARAVCPGGLAGARNEQAFGADAPVRGVGVINANAFARQGEGYR